MGESSKRLDTVLTFTACLFGSMLGALIFLSLFGEAAEIRPTIKGSWLNEIREWLSFIASASAAIVVALTLRHVAKQGDATALQVYQVQLQKTEREIGALMSARPVLWQIKEITDRCKGLNTIRDPAYEDAENRKRNIEQFHRMVDFVSENLPTLVRELSSIGDTKSRTLLGDMQDMFDVFRLSLRGKGSVPDNNMAVALKKSVDPIYDSSLKKLLPRLEEEQEKLRELYDLELTKLRK